MQSLIAVRARSYGRDVDARRAISRPVDSPVLFQVVLALEGLAAHFARVGDVVAVTALVDHQVVGLGETTLAVLANKVGPWSHSTSVGRAPVLRIVGHNSKHLELFEGSLMMTRK